MLKDIVPKHSVRGYLSRQSTEDLETILNYYLQGDLYKNYGDVILTILNILEERFVPDKTSKEYIRAKEFLSKHPYIKKD